METWVVLCTAGLGGLTYGLYCLVDALRARP
jgi:hypothetical protein